MSSIDFATAMARIVCVWRNAWSSSVSAVTVGTGAGVAARVGFGAAAGAGFGAGGAFDGA